MLSACSRACSSWLARLRAEEAPRGGAVCGCGCSCAARARCARLGIRSGAGAGLERRFGSCVCACRCATDSKENGRRSAAVPSAEAWVAAEEGAREACGGSAEEAAPGGPLSTSSTRLRPVASAACGCCSSIGLSGGALDAMGLPCSITIASWLGAVRVVVIVGAGTESLDDRAKDSDAGRGFENGFEIDSGAELRKLTVEGATSTCESSLNLAGFSDSDGDLGDEGGFAAVSTATLLLDRRRGGGGGGGSGRLGGG